MASSFEYSTEETVLYRTRCRHTNDDIYHLFFVEPKDERLIPGLRALHPQTEIEPSDGHLMRFFWRINLQELHVLRKKLKDMESDWLDPLYAELALLLAAKSTSLHSTPVECQPNATPVECQRKKSTIPTGKIGEYAFAGETQQTFCITGPNIRRLPLDWDSMTAGFFGRDKAWISKRHLEEVVRCLEKHAIKK